MPAHYPNGRVMTDDVFSARMAFMTHGQATPQGVRPHDDLMAVVPFLGMPNPLWSVLGVRGGWLCGSREAAPFRQATQERVEVRGAEFGLGAAGTCTRVTSLPGGASQ